MAETTEIAWCDSTFNPWIGCSKVSPGCANCYANELDDKRFSKMLGEGTKENPISHWGKGAPRHRTSDSNWMLPLRWNNTAICDLCGKIAKLDGYPQGGCDSSRINGVACRFRRPRVFCASLADWLDDEVPIEWLADLLELIHATPNLSWLLLTKRPENWRPRLARVAAELDGKGSVFAALWLSGLGEQIPGNIWLDTTVENQAMADKRIPVLLSIPARVRFLSCEPLLGPLDLRLTHLITIGRDYSTPDHEPIQVAMNEQIHWIISGGESGPNARPSHPHWHRSLSAQCQIAGVKYLFKQHGEHVECDQGNCEAKEHRFVELDGTDSTSRSIFDHTETTAHMVRVGKKTAGRLLDGREWNEFPEVAQ